MGLAPVQPTVEPLPHTEVTWSEGGLPYGYMSQVVERELARRQNRWWRRLWRGLWRS